MDRSKPNPLRDELQQAGEALRAELAAGNDGVELARARARMLDATLARHFERTCQKLDVSPAKAPIALAAAGSYGRGVMALHSDVDVRLLSCGRTTAAARALSEALLYPLWDAGLDVGHQLLAQGEALALAKDDLSTATALLDLRALAGDASVVRALRERFVSRLRASNAGFMRALTADTKSRHERFGDSVYLLEPDVKLGTGGLRDLEVARWAAASRGAPQSPRPSDAPEPLDLLVEDGALDRRELDAALAAERFLWRVRNRLHAGAARRSDRLTFDAQEALAVAMGYGREGEIDAERRAEAAERFMQQHYVHARAITRVAERALSFCAPRPARRGKVKDLGDGLLLRDGAVAFADADAVSRDPSLALRAYAACSRHGARIEDAARDAIARAAAVPELAEALRKGERSGELFVELLCEVEEAPVGGGSIARELLDVGLLLAMIPEFLPVTGRVHHDVYHVLTVDVHSVAAVDCLRALARGELSAAQPLATRLGAEIARPRPLFVATLLHDIGKGHPGKDGSRKNHSESGAELCEAVLPRLGLRPDEVADARSLVLHHLAMYHLATRRDLDDPGTVDELCRIVRGREGLRDLYLLTVADISTTSPAAMTSWKAHMLEELYLRADAKLAGAPTRVDEERVEAVRVEARTCWPEGATAIDAFVASMPMRYLLATPAASIAMHARLAQERKGRAAVVGVGPARESRPDHELLVVAKDRPGLLARVAAALTASRLEVHAAQIHTRQTAGGDAEAVDVFFVRDPSYDEAGFDRKLARVQADLVELCEDRITAEELVADRAGSRSPWASRATPDIRSRVVFDERTSPHHTIVEVFAKDRPGLLFRLARALEELRLSIALSKINTEGTKVADVFYVDEIDGGKVEGKARLAAIEAKLLEAIDPTEARHGGPSCGTIEVPKAGGAS